MVTDCNHLNRLNFHRAWRVPLSMHSLNRGPLHIEVACRIRPLALSSARSTVPIRSSFGSYEVHKVYHECCSQDEVFTGSVLPAVNSFLQVNT